MLDLGRFDAAGAGLTQIRDLSIHPDDARAGRPPPIHLLYSIVHIIRQAG